MFHYSLFASGAGDYREEKENSTLSFDLAIVCGQRQHCTFTSLPGHCLILGRALAAGRGHRWWISLQTLPPDPLQHHQLPRGQQLSMSSGRHQEKPSMEHSSHAAHAPCPTRLDHSPGTATLHMAIPSEDGAPHIQPQDQSMWKQLCPHCLRDTAMHTDSNITLSQVQSFA